MASNLAIGSAIIVLTFFIHSVGLILLTSLLSVVAERLPFRDFQMAKIVAMLIAATGLLVLLGVEIVVWAVGLVNAGAFADFETALYFSTSTFATVGFGDVAPAPEWRLLASMEGVAGFLIIGWSTVYLVTAGIRFGPFERDTHF